MAAFRSRLAGFAALAGLTASVLLGACGGSGDRGPTRFEVKTVEAGSAPEHLAYGYDALWVATTGGVARIDPKGDKREMVMRDAGSGPIAAGEGAVWASDGSDGTVARIDPRTRRAGPSTQVIPLDRDEGVGAIATGGGAVWAAAEDKLVELDPGSGRVRGEPIVIGGYAKRAVVAGGSVWVLISTGFEARRGARPSGAPESKSLPENDGTLVKVDPEARKVVRRLRVGESPGDLAAGAGSLWVIDTAQGGLRRLDPKDGRQTGRASEVSGNFLAVDSGGVWVSDTRANKVGRFEPETGRLSAGPFVIPVDGSTNSAEVGELALGAGSTWVASPIGPKIGRLQP